MIWKKETGRSILAPIPTATNVPLRREQCHRHCGGKTHAGLRRCRDMAIQDGAPVASIAKSMAPRPKAGMSSAFRSSAALREA